MKVCLISLFYYPYEVGGAPVAVRIVAESLKKRGHEVFVITTGPKSSKPFSEEIQYGIKVYRFYSFGTNIPTYTGKISNIGRIFTFLLGFWNPHTYFVVKKILKKENPDAVHINEVPYLSLSVYSAAKSLNLPTISTIRRVLLLFPMNNIPYFDKKAGVCPPFGSYNIYKKISNISAQVNKIIINSPTCVIFHSNALLNKYLEHSFFKRSKKIVTSNIFEIDEFGLRKEIRKKSFDIFYAGGLVRMKGGHTLIKAFKKIGDRNIRLHIFGTDEDEPFFKKLSRGDERIIFHGKMSNEEFQRELKNSDVSVVPSECFEAFGRVIIESFSAHVPVIGSNIGGIPEIIQEDHTGFLFEPGNVEELTDILEKVINNKEKLIKMGENAFKEAKKYSIENNIHKLEEIYKETIDSKE